MRRNFKGVFIPKEIWLDDFYSHEQKIVIGALQCYKWVDAETLANFIGISKGRLIYLMSGIYCIAKKKIIKNDKFVTVYRFYDVDKEFEKTLRGE